MKTILISLSAVFLFGVLFYAVVGSRMAVDKDEIQGACLREATAAQEYALLKICTQEARLLSCGGDVSFTYEAQNGCEISYLLENGWK
ncbi:MAG: hypothetical protein HYS73_00200 [Parcubacteria group bacterium]|nr:hypothetical protein [Parcubacteria group bacterium]